jgi:hypothetical protein
MIPAIGGTVAMTMAIRTVADADVRARPDSSDMEADADICTRRRRRE